MDQSNPQRRERAAVFSLGLWRNRHDLAQLLDLEIVHPLQQAEHCVGWGRRPSYLRSKQSSERRNLPLITLEDGFLAGYLSRLGEPRHSYVIDRTGIYFDTRFGNDLETLIANHPVDTEGQDWARRTMSVLVEQEITKFNGWPDGTPESFATLRKPFVLVVDQVATDASIAGSGADAARFKTMLLHAADTAAGRAIVVRTHPAAAASSLLLQAASETRIPVVVAPMINPWRLVKQADAVWTIASQMGFEAAMAGKVVHAFGRSFYAGRGFTEDHFSGPRQTPCETTRLFHLFYQRYMCCLDVHTRQPCDFDRALEQALTIRTQRDKNTVRIFTGGLSPWKRKAVSPFLVGSAGRPLHLLTRPAAERAAQREGGVVAIWGTKTHPPDFPHVRVEDGFIRSSGLGAALVLPSSLVLDGRGAHFDCRQESALEHILQNQTFTPPELARAKALRIQLVRLGVTKYNTGAAPVFPDVPDGKLKILVPGQVEADASIRFGSPRIKTNKALIAAVRDLFPDAFIVYKIHPDAAAGWRSAGDMPVGHDCLALEGSAQHWLEWCDRVETMTSLMGFEGLLRERAVGVHGIPAYAGWGLTEDRVPLARRTRRLTLDELVAGMLVRYPQYVHPVSRLPCRPEDLADILAKPEVSGTAQVSIGSRMVNRVAIMLRDRRNR